MASRARRARGTSDDDKVATNAPEPRRPRGSIPRTWQNRDRLRQYGHTFCLYHQSDIRTDCDLPKRSYNAPFRYIVHAVDIHRVAQRAGSRHHADAGPLQIIGCAGDVIVVHSETAKVCGEFSSQYGSPFYGYTGSYDDAIAILCTG